MMDRKTIWESAGRTGLILGLASISYVVISELLGSIQSESKAVMALINVFGNLLWLAKLVGCILIMRAAMYKFSDEYIEADNSDTLKFGMASALLSALAFSTFYLADMLFIHPDMITKAIEASQEVFGSMLDSNAIEMMEQMAPKLPAITFFTNLLWCTVYGCALSAILSRNIPPQNPFANDHE